MAGKNQVTLTFAGDSTKLEQAFSKVGESARGMQDDVKKSSKGTSESFDKVGESFDNNERRALGFKDTLDGVGGTMEGVGKIAKGDLYGGLLLVGQGVADLSGGIATFVVPALKSAVSGFKGAASAAKAFTLSLLTNPIFLIGAAIALLVVGLVILYKKSETARNIMNAAFRGIATVIATVVIGALRFFQGMVNGALLMAEKIVSIMGKLPGPLGAPFRAAAGGIRAFRGTVNAEFDKAIAKVNELNNKIQGLPSRKNITINFKVTGSGASIALNAPGSFGRRAAGGPVSANRPYMVGEDGPEMFVPSGSGFIVPNGARGNSRTAGTQTVNVVLTVEGNGDLVQVLRNHIRVKGGNVQTVLGT